MGIISVLENPFSISRFIPLGRKKKKRNEIHTETHSLKWHSVFVQLSFSENIHLKTNEVQMYKNS